MKKVVALLMGFSMLASFGSVSVTANAEAIIPGTEYYVNFLKNQDAGIKKLQVFAEEWNASDYNSTLVLHKGFGNIHTYESDNYITIEVLGEPEYVDETIQAVYAFIRNETKFDTDYVFFDYQETFTDEVVPNPEKITDPETICDILRPFIETLTYDGKLLDEIEYINIRTSDYHGNPSFPENMVEIVTSACGLHGGCTLKYIVDAIDTYAAEQGIDTNMLTYTLGGYGMPLEEISKPSGPLFIDWSADMDENDTIDLTDVSMILAQYAEQAVNPDAVPDTSLSFLCKGDVNNDGVIDITDASQVLKVYANNAAGLE